METNKLNTLVADYRKTKGEYERYKGKRDLNFKVHLEYVYNELCSIENSLIHLSIKRIRKVTPLDTTALNKCNTALLDKMSLEREVIIDRLIEEVTL